MKKKYQTKITKLKNNNEIQEVSDESVSHSVVSSKVMLRVVPAEKQKVFNLVDKSDKNKKLAGPSFGSSLMRKK